MDTITTAILAAIGNLSQDAIKDSYKALKYALRKNFGEKSDLTDAVEKLEKQPDSKARKALLAEEVEAAQANDDPEVLDLAQKLLEQLHDLPGGQQSIRQTINAKYAATSATGDAAIHNISDTQSSESKG